MCSGKKNLANCICCGTLHLDKEAVHFFGIFACHWCSSTLSRFLCREAKNIIADPALATTKKKIRRRPFLTVMRNPPPMPMLCGLTTPLQKMVATAASTAVPPLARISLTHGGQYVIHILYSSAYKIQYSVCWLNYTAFKGLKGQKRKK